MALNSSVKGWSLCRAYQVLYDIFRAVLSLEIMVIWSLNILIGEGEVKHSATSLSFLYGVLVTAALKDSCYEVSSVDTSWPCERSSIYFLTCKVNIVQFIQPLSQRYVSTMVKLKTIMPLGLVPQASGLGFPQNLLHIARNVSSFVSSWPASWEHHQLFLCSFLERIIVSKVLLVCDGFNLQTSPGNIILLLYLS